MWRKYVSNAVLNYNTSYHTNIGCEPSRVFRGQIPYNILEIELGIPPQQAPNPILQNAQDVFDQMAMIKQDVRRKAKQAYIKYKAYYDKKANASQLKEADNVNVLLPKADQQGSKNPFTEIRCLGPYIIENVLPKTNYMVRKIDTKKTQVLHRVPMRHFTPHQSPPDKRIMPQKWTPDPEVSLKLDDLFARAWECEYKKPFFDAENNNAAPPTSPKFPIQSDLSTEAMRNRARNGQSVRKNFFLKWKNNVT